MSFLREILFFFALVYGCIVVHYATYDRADKKRRLDEVASVLKTIEPSVSYPYETYRKFVYAQ